MANFVLRLSISPGEIEDFLREFQRRIDNPLPLNKRIGQLVVDKTDERFRTQTDPEGQRWQDLKPATWQRKRRSTSSILKILQERGTLRDSIVYEADNQGVSVGSNLVYAAIHQFGGEIHQRARTGYLNYKLGRDGRPGNRFVKRRNADFQQTVEFGERTINIAARPYLGISDAYLEEIGELVGDYLLGN